MLADLWDRDRIIQKAHGGRGPQGLRDTEDTGYGDLRMRKNGDVVVVSYHGSFAEAAVKQYVVRVEA